METLEHRPRLRVGVVGASGFVGRAHVEAIGRTGLAEVVVIAGSSLDSARSAARDLRVSAIADSAEALASSDVDVVHNCTPTGLHGVVARTVLDHGRHLVTEKPLAASLEEAEGLVSAARAAGTVVAVCQNYRHYPMVQEARALVADGAIGTPHVAHGHYLQDWMCGPGASGWRLDPANGPSASFADIGTHWCDLVSHLTGQRITEVHARTGALHGRALEDHAVVSLRFAGGMLGSLVASQSSAGRKNRLWFQVDGDEGSLSWNQERPEELRLGRPGRVSEDVSKVRPALSPAAAALARVPQGHPEGWSSTFRNLFAATYRRILGDTAPGDDAVATVDDGRAMMELVEAVVLSASCGEPVVLSGERAPSGGAR